MTNEGSDRFRPIVDGEEIDAVVVRPLPGERRYEIEGSDGTRTPAHLGPMWAAPHLLKGESMRFPRLRPGDRVRVLLSTEASDGFITRIT